MGRQHDIQIRSVALRQFGVNSEIYEKKKKMSFAENHDVGKFTVRRDYYKSYPGMSDDLLEYCLSHSLFWMFSWL